MADENGSGVGDAVFRRLLSERIIFLGAEVEQANANAICAQILLLSAEDPTRDIQLYINSPGGSVTAGMAVYDTMQLVPADVATYAVGLAGSMAQTLLCAGAPGKRYALPHARILMHQISGGVGGTAADVAIQAENMLYMKRQNQEVIARHTGQPVERIAADADRDRWFTADEAREYGMVDHVLASVDELPSLG
ncbi:ClpP family protease [Actinocatenispora rupis]|uniref:ATP-dependent Clp protease proteolytic subunit n=1 Tax=Actinocatenispora rupis TaxID=519421 RepID=A0A8J3J991_9ACTN|nr:ATP-dependent Clp protease proteolytic subunit [Actinocatenispora rupis]GID16268.1 ATP-dependent Clp protease proteolytic subunit 2 [Actinocatenispora rupis]